MSSFREPCPERSALFTDLYELTMAQAYLAKGMNETAVFELFFRKLPSERNYIVAAGLDDVLSYLEHWEVADEDIRFLQTRGQFSERFLSELKTLRFTGDVYAMREGTPVFPHEPLIQVVAPLCVAQLMETFILNQMHCQSVLAAKAARVVTAAEGRNVVDFGSRRAHGTDAALKVARASYLVGAGATSNVFASRLYGIPAVGTMAHSYIQAHDDETAALDAFAREFPDTTLLVDTYDTLTGIRKVIALRNKLGERFRVRAVRLDSGNLVQLSKQSRQMLDAAGLQDVKIFASSGLDEHAIRELISAGAPIDGFGVGTKMVVSDDAPALDMAYKLVEYRGRPRMKLSSDKVLYPGRKQVFRKRDDGGMMTGDCIGRYDEDIDGEPLLQPVMKEGRRLDSGRVPLDEARAYATRELQHMPAEIRSLNAASTPYPVMVSDRLQADLERVRHDVADE